MEALIHKKGDVFNVVSETEINPHDNFKWGGAWYEVLTVLEQRKERTKLEFTGIKRFWAVVTGKIII